MDWWGFLVEWYHSIINSVWLYPILVPVADFLDKLYHAFVGGGNANKERQND